MTGFKTYAVAGEEDNIKITTPRDLVIAEALLKSRSDL
jgi:2-C-methyl-D-erythritol 4-phosphate cytidylyltransferase